jgi:hypothetical protein
MNCTRCGSNVPGETAACPRCGTRLAAPGAAGAHQLAERAASPAFRLDASRWTRGDRITGIGTLALFISLFLPWYGVSILGISAEVDGLTGHGYLYIVLISCLAIITYLGASAGFEELPARLPLSHRQRLLAASGLNAALVLLAFLVRPGLLGWRYGAFAAIIAALGAVAPQVIPAVQARRARA